MRLRWENGIVAWRCGLAVALAALLALAGPSMVQPLMGGELSSEARDAALETVRRVGPQGAGNAAAARAARTLVTTDGKDLLPILRAMRGTSDIAANWLRGVAEGAAQRSLDRGERLPVSQLEAFLMDTDQSPRARRLAYELVEGVDPLAKERLIPQLLDDPSAELRRDAVAHQLEIAASATGEMQLAAYQRAFDAARDLDQIKQAAAELKRFGHPADIAAHMGFITSWHLVAPFDNIADRGWDAVYPPEKQVDLSAEYDGQKGMIGWSTHTTTDDFGLVDLNKSLGKHKGAVAYAYVELDSPREQPVEMRLASVTAVKLWLNGKLLDERHVYHSGMEIDQYTTRATLRPGKNAILVKICQNEQTDGWAQDWKFQLRVCDAIGGSAEVAVVSPKPTPTKNSKAE